MLPIRFPTWICIINTHEDSSHDFTIFVRRYHIQKLFIHIWSSHVFKECFHALESLFLILFCQILKRQIRCLSGFIGFNLILSLTLPYNFSIEFICLLSKVLIKRGKNIVRWYWFLLRDDLLWSNQCVHIYSRFIETKAVKDVEFCQSCSLHQIKILNDTFFCLFFWKLLESPLSRFPMLPKKSLTN